MSRGRDGRRYDRNDGATVGLTGAADSGVHLRERLTRTEMCCARECGEAVLFAAAEQKAEE